MCDNVCLRVGLLGEGVVPSGGRGRGRRRRSSSTTGSQRFEWEALVLPGKRLNYVNNELRESRHRINRGARARRGSGGTCLATISHHGVSVSTLSRAARLDLTKPPRPAGLRPPSAVFPPLLPGFIRLLFFVVWSVGAPLPSYVRVLMRVQGGRALFLRLWRRRWLKGEGCLSSGPSCAVGTTTTTCTTPVDRTPPLGNAPSGPLSLPGRMLIPPTVLLFRPPPPPPPPPTRRRRMSLER